jgi:hypothetical protein
MAGVEVRWRRGTGLPFQVLDGQAVVLVPARRESHELDEAATFLWERLGEARTEGELAAALVEEFEVGEEEAARDVRGFLAELESKGLAARG